MVAQVYEKACKAKSLDEVIVAIDADETAEALKEWNGSFERMESKNRYDC